ncbi:MAG TPA: glycosyltransferase [Gemmataceae bacterium]|nr:glycosyltransferase [Gemmataceae bacterium]
MASGSGIVADSRQWLSSQGWAQPLKPLVRRVRRLVRPALWLPWGLVRAYQTAALLRYFLWLKWVAASRIRVGPRGSGPSRIVMLVCSQLHVDPRVEREARALAGNGFLVTVICPAWYESGEERPKLNWGPGIDFRILPRAAGRFVYGFPYLFGAALLRSALREDAQAYHAHDLNMALVALVAAARKQAACVCDFHEWYSENVTYDEKVRSYRPHPLIKRCVYQAMERLAIRSATEVITVCESIGQQLEKTYRAAKPIHIIRNIPPLPRGTDPGDSRFTDLRRALGIAADRRIVLYQGGLGPSRNLEPIIRAMPMVRDAVFVIRGPGHETYATDYLKLARAMGAGDKVFCLGPVPSAEVVAEARAADVGAWTLLSNVGLNFKLALPNKVFEYLAAGLPVLAADLPEVRKLVQGYQVGLCFDPESPTSIAGAINQLVGDRSFWESCRANIPHALQDLRADREWDKLVGLYRGLMGQD